MMNEPMLAQRLPIPCTVSPGGVAVVLVDDRVARDGVKGSGNVDACPWRRPGRHLEAVVHAQTFNVPHPLGSYSCGVATMQGFVLPFTLTPGNPTGQYGVAHECRPSGASGTATFLYR